MKSRSLLALLAAASLAGAGALVHSGCDVSSANEVVRATGVDFTGFYSNANGPMIQNNTGADITTMNLRQTGDRLEGVDNNGMIFRGSLSETGDNAASFLLKGSTTAGQEGTLNGSLTGSGTAATLSGTWIEPTLISAAFATATINPNTTPTNGTSNLTISPSGTVNLTVNGTRTFTANGGSGTYTWAVSSTSLGSLSTTTGASVTYTARSTGTQTLTLSDGRNSPVTASVVQTTSTSL